MQSLSTNAQSNDIIRDVIERFEKPFTVKALFDALADAGASVSRATVYRVLNTWCGKGWMRLVILPDSRHVYAHTEEGKTLCVIECTACGKLSSCDAAEFDRCINAEALRQHMNPLQTTIYMRAKCAKGHC